MIFNSAETRSYLKVVRKVYKEAMCRIAGNTKAIDLAGSMLVQIQ
jgi:hypothetical protein